MKIAAKHRHELFEAELEVVPEHAVGAWVAHDGDLFAVMPVASLELLEPAFEPKAARVLEAQLSRARSELEER